MDKKPINFWSLAVTCFMGENQYKICQCNKINYCDNNNNNGNNNNNNNNNDNNNNYKNCINNNVTVMIIITITIIVKIIIIILAIIIVTLMINWLLGIFKEFIIQNIGQEKSYIDSRRHWIP